MIGNEIHNLAQKLWPINRSITGEGVRETLKVISSIIPNLKAYSVPSQTKVFDWVVDGIFGINRLLGRILEGILWFPGNVLDEG